MKINIIKKNLMKINKKYIYIFFIVFLIFILFINIPKKENMSLDKIYETLDLSYNKMDGSGNRPPKPPGERPPKPTGDRPPPPPGLPGDRPPPPPGLPKDLLPVPTS